MTKVGDRDVESICASEVSAKRQRHILTSENRYRRFGYMLLDILQFL